MLKHIIHPHIQLLPNTSGVRTAEEAVFAAQMAREAFGTNWLKLEIHPDPRYLLPDSTETLKATEELVKLGFVVLPYCQADPHFANGWKKPALLPSCRWVHLSVRIKDCRPETFCGLSSNRPLSRGGRCRYRCSQPRCRSNGNGCFRLSGKYGHCRSRKPHSYGTSLQTSRRSRTYGL